MSASTQESAPDDGVDSAMPSLLRAIRGEPGPRVPVWFMRQAGRSLPEYFPVRGDGTILDAIAAPERAAEITMQPVRRYGVDAAILFSDIVTPVWASGFGIDIAPGVGPVCEKPFASSTDLDRLRPIDPVADLTFQTETVKILVDELDVPPHRIRRRSLHPGGVPDRGPPVQGPCEGEVADGVGSRPVVAAV